MSTLAFRDVPDGISEARSMIVYFYIWNLTWINIWRIEDTIVIIVIIIYLLTLYGILRCAAMILYANLAFSCIDRFIPTVASLFWCVFCGYIYILPLCYIPHLLIFLRCSLAFVILPVSILLVFMPLFSETCLPFCYSSQTEYPLFFCLPTVMLPTPYHRRFNNVFVTIFFIYYSFCVLLYFK